MVFRHWVSHLLPSLDTRYHCHPKPLKHVPIYKCYTHTQELIKLHFIHALFFSHNHVYLYIASNTFTFHFQAYTHQPNKKKNILCLFFCLFCFFFAFFFYKHLNFLVCYFYTQAYHLISMQYIRYPISIVCQNRCL